MKKIRIGADPFPPFQYYDENGCLQGSDYEKVERIVRSRRYEAEYVIDDWKVVEQMLLNKELDVAFQVQKTPERERQYHFSKLFRNATTSIIRKSGESAMTTLQEDLSESSRIAVIRGYCYGDPVDAIREPCKVFVENQKEVVRAVANGRAKYGVVDLEVYEHESSTEYEGRIQVIREFDFTRPLYLVFADEALRDEFDAVM